MVVNNLTETRYTTKNLLFKSGENWTIMRIFGANSYRIIVDDLDALEKITALDDALFKLLGTPKQTK